VVMRLTCNEDIGGSIPSLGTNLGSHRLEA